MSEILEEALLSITDPDVTGVVCSPQVESLNGDEMCETENSDGNDREDSSKKLEDITFSPSAQKEKKTYMRYTDEQRLEIAQHSIQNGCMRTSRHFTIQLGFKVSESTVRSIRTQYQKRLKKDPESNQSLKSLPKLKTTRHQSAQLRTPDDPEQPVQDRIQTVVDSVCTENESSDSDETDEEISNDEIDKIVLSTSTQNLQEGIKKRTAKYMRYTADQRLEIAQHAVEHGPSRAARHFTSLLGFNVSESTVRYIQRQYETRLKKNPDSLESLPKAKIGRPTLLPKSHDEAVQEHIQTIINSGGAVNMGVVIAIGKSVMASQRAVPSGSIKLSRAWASSIMKRMGFTPKKRTKKPAAKPVNAPLTPAQIEFINRITTTARESHIPADLVINIDQCLMNLAPLTCADDEDPSGNQPANVNGKKRIVGTVLGCTLTGDLLPLQIIYCGKTEICHATYSFPVCWNITHNPKAVSTTDTMEKYIEELLSQYVQRIRAEKGLAEDQPALCILKPFWATSPECVVRIINACFGHHIRLVFAPVPCSDNVLPLDLACKTEFKTGVRGHFMQWYAAQVNALSSSEVDTRFSVMKPLNADWMLQAWQALGLNKTVVISGWDYAGVKSAFYMS
ncbi:hypothetical protein CAPTEDRAFT_213251 [Capitella teleta]|uniref:DDE-1 domain-containing protein n=1 Tax=Capitella teleta TaxID=283909 RepID=R7UY39_CAPTE|nr:hypothetical protein CAPTEDRAFT_213251 [Capitella teleta]|eukprot:ELU08351.1 hypothetical protein CAPTEDRAFT_213251 [Capitella teleta]